MEIFTELTNGYGSELYDISALLPKHKKIKAHKRVLSFIKRLVVHTSDTDWDVLTIAEYHIQPNHISSTGCPSIAYHDVITMDGVVMHTVPYNHVTWHAGEFNDKSIGVCLLYRATNPETKKDEWAPSPQSMFALVAHLSHLCLDLGILPKNVVGHRELPGTGYYIEENRKVLRKRCPGLKIDLDLLRNKVAKLMQLELQIAGYYTGKIDGSFGPGSISALTNYIKEN